MAEYTDIQVLKRDGTREPFDPDKIVRVTQAAGLDPDQAKKLAGEIADWAQKSGLSQLTTLQLRDLVIGKLHKYDEAAAKMFVWYQMTKLKDT